MVPRGRRLSTLEHREAPDSMLVAPMSNGVRTGYRGETRSVEPRSTHSRELTHEYFQGRFELISTCEPDLGSDDPNRVYAQIFGAVAQLDKSKYRAEASSSTSARED